MPLPDFPYGEAATGGEAPHLDSKETSEQTTDTTSYRQFAIAACRRDIDFADSIYQAIDRADSSHKAAVFRGCRTSAWFVRHNVSGEIRVASSKCHARWCPLCIKSRRYVITLAAIKYITAIDRPKFLTLTMKHSNAPLKNQIENLYRNFKEFRRRPWTKKRLKGGIWFFQIKRSEQSGQWHPHLHILLDAKFTPKEEISEKWLETTKSSNIIDIRAIHNAKKAAEYVARYSAAPCRLVDYSIDDALEIVRALHGQRIVGTFGTAKGIKLSAQKPDDAEAWERLDSFSTTALNRHYDPKYRDIWTAWIKGTKTDRTADEFKPPPVLPDEKIIEEPETFRQFTFSFTTAL
jgi:hypothetical protein